MNSTLEKVGWVAEPDGRGTIGLLWSCFATIFICTWSAVHPNVPADDDTHWTIFWRKARYMLLSVIAPEAMAALAFNQLFAARRLMKKRDPKQRLRLRPKELVYLFKSSTLPLPDIYCSDIDDRSKANWVAKSIALVQIIWFLAQLLGRAIQRLPITTIELFTLGIVFCAFMTYVFWWQKPFDVQKPIVLQIPADVNLQMPKEKGKISLFDNSYVLYESSYFTYVTGTIFGVLHVAAWNFVFPTYPELIIWRIASICCCATPFVFGVVSICDGCISLVVSGSLALLYFSVRAYMFVEMLVGLRAVPMAIYKTPNWSQYFPALG